MKKLLQGIIKFRQTAIEDYRNKFSKLAIWQMPDALLVACCDSRVVPNVFASSEPGDLFVMRNLGNLIPLYQEDQADDNFISSVVELSLVKLNIPDIIICGHSECGAMQALLENASQTDPSLPALNKWLQNAASSYQRFLKSPLDNEENLTPCDRLSRINVLQQLANLKTYPLVNERLKENKLRIHGWWFDLTTADVYYYDPLRKKFIVIDEEEAEKILASLV